MVRTCEIHDVEHGIWLIACGYVGKSNAIA
jgi:hypothetical protein